MDTTTDDRGVGLSLLFGLAALGAAGYTLLASFRSATTTSAALASALQVEAAIGFAATLVFGALVIAAIHLY